MGLVRICDYYTQQSGKIHCSSGVFRFGVAAGGAAPPRPLQPRQFPKSRISAGTHPFRDLGYFSPGEKKMQGTRNVTGLPIRDEIELEMDLFGV
jgi:hypothetical protein